MQKVIYFTATGVPTSGELSEIAALNERAQAPLEILVRNAEVSNAYGVGPEAADYIMGTRPAAYADEEDFPALPELPDADTTALVEDAQEIAITGGTVAFTIEGGEITGGAFTPTP